MKNLLKWFNADKKEVDLPIGDSWTPPVPLSQDMLLQESHIHDWELINKTYAPPAGDVKGLTNLLFECSTCKEFKMAEMIGSDETQLEDIIIKVETFGSQLFKFHETFYVVSKYIPPTQQQSNIPIR